MRGASASSAGPALSAGPAAQTWRSGADARRSARSARVAAAASAAASSTTLGRETLNTVARDRWLARQPTGVVNDAAQNGEWQPAVRWTLGNLLQAVAQENEVQMRLQAVTQEQGHNAMSSALEAVVDWLTEVVCIHTRVQRPRNACRTVMLDWLNEVVCIQECHGEPWHLLASQCMARAYENTLLLTKRYRIDKETIRTFSRHMRDVLVVGAIIQAGRHADEDEVRAAFQAIFDRQLDKDMNAQLMHSYHQLLHGVPSAFLSGCKRGRPRRRPARVRQQHVDASATEGEEGATEGETEAQGRPNRPLANHTLP